MMNRRGFLALSALGLLSTGAHAQAAPRIVVLGGGAGGATAARVLRSYGGPRVDITLIEQDPRYVTCFFSNWVIGG